jgi:hypothetical protein
MILWQARVVLPGHERGPLVNSFGMLHRVAMPWPGARHRDALSPSTPVQDAFNDASFKLRAGVNQASRNIFRATV